MKAKTIRPNSLRILGRDVRVTYSPDLDAYGYFHAMRQEIQVRDGVSSIEEADTLVHEAMHAAWNYMDIGLPKHEEFVVRKLATAMTLILKENPELLKYLSKP